MSKIAIFYMIGQYGEQWESDFYNDQINLLHNSGLYDKTQLIEVYVKGRTPLQNIPEKFNNITYIGELEEETPINKKLYRTYNYIQQRMWNFSQCNPDYKILFFHSLGVSHGNPTIYKNKYAWRKYLETLLIGNWKECLELLDYYDCVGTEYVPLGSYTNQTNVIYAPHYQGFFWWANSNYIKKLDPNYMYQDVVWQPWLCELWIGSGNPRAYSFFNSGMNHYEQEIHPPYDSILSICRTHLNRLKQGRKKDEL